MFEWLVWHKVFQLSDILSAYYFIFTALSLTMFTINMATLLKIKQNGYKYGIYSIHDTLTTVQGTS